jgi:hypothetical protein
MKKISIVIFCFITIISFAQNDKISDLEKVSIALPDTIFVDSDFYFPSEHRTLFWKQYKTNKYEFFDPVQDKTIGNLNLFFDNDSIFWEAYLDKKGNLLRIMIKNSDAIPTIEIKIFEDDTKIIGVSFKYYNSATIVTEKVRFLEYKEAKFIDITKEVLSSFNYNTDNYSDSTNNLISEMCEFNVQLNPPNNLLLYTFTPNDTIYISDCFYGIEEDIGLDTTYFDGEFYTKKYTMENGKLRLAE